MMEKEAEVDDLVAQLAEMAEKLSASEADAKHWHQCIGMLQNDLRDTQEQVC